MILVYNFDIYDPKYLLFPDNFHLLIFVEQLIFSAMQELIHFFHFRIMNYLLLLVE